ncbi:alpha-tubulin N-acetyltransferase 1, partial [Dunckerocampus dactyliophorus]|uniref:alpha-tubulin N-acetyltransferase 1 n=1 Tax=Dunckerocampus dactyliophorus TaxID=161453 RepID=UPI0024072A2C
QVVGVAALPSSPSSSREASLKVLPLPLVGGATKLTCVALQPNLQSHIVTVIDELGRASAKAQKLTTPVTSANKLQSQLHQVYLMKDGESNGGRGVIVGFLKVGYKKLFLLDQQGVHVEAEPLCVLDFFVAQNLQRHGYGLELFNFMLQDKNLEPVLMAYDRPSPKLLSFLAKHYCLTQSVPQVNHFVVFDGFFLNKSVAQLRKAPLKKPDGEIKPYSLMEREAVRQEQRTPPWPFAHPRSSQRSVFSQYSHSLSVGSSPTRVPPQAATVPAPGVHRDQNPHFPLERCRARSNSQQCQAARGHLHSRYTDTISFPRLGRPLSGLRSGHADVASIPRPQSRLVTHPPPSTSMTNVTCIPPSQCNRATTLRSMEHVVGLAKEVKAAEGAAGDISSSGWSWNAGNGCFSAQQVTPCEGPHLSLSEAAGSVGALTVTATNSLQGEMEMYYATLPSMLFLCRLSS